MICLIKDSQERKARGEVPKVDYKLAVPVREKRAKVEKKGETVDVPKEPELSEFQAETFSWINKISSPEKLLMSLIYSQGPQLLSAVKSVAADLDGDPQTTENDLVQKLKTQQTEKINLRYGLYKIHRCLKSDANLPFLTKFCSDLLVSCFWE